VDAPRLRTWLRTLASLYFLTCIAFIWLFAAGEPGSWRDPTSWPAFVRIVAISLIVAGCYLPIHWLSTHISGPETSTRRFAILATIFIVAVLLVVAIWAISEPAGVVGWVCLAAGISVAGLVIRGIWSQAR
jgi:O-antigen/teichoic acid export membrane protein